MSGKRNKKLRKKAKQILVEWLHSVLPDEEDHKQITVSNIEDFLGEQTHLYVNRNLLLSAYSLKWIYKRVKRNPDLTFEQLQKDLEQEQKPAQGRDYYL